MVGGWQENEGRKIDDPIFLPHKNTTRLRLYDLPRRGPILGVARTSLAVPAGYEP